MKLSLFWTTVTPLSKLLALLLYISLPFIGFILGVRYQKSITIIDYSLRNMPPLKPTPVSNNTVRSVLIYTDTIKRYKNANRAWVTDSLNRVVGDCQPEVLIPSIFWPALLMFKLLTALHM